MESIVKKLSEIEQAAAAIVANAEAQKSILDKEYHEKTKQFDDELESKTQARIKEIKDEHERNLSQLLDEQSGTNTNSIEELKKEYVENHSKYAQDILRRITEV